MAAVAAVYDKIKEAGADVLAISTDTKFVHEAFVKNEPLMKNVKFILASDPTGKVCREYQAYMEDAGLAMRALYIINPEGNIVYLESSIPPVGKSTAEIMRKFLALKYVTEHPDEACPANWEPGKKTLKPGPKLVGNVGNYIDEKELLEITYRDFRMG